MKRLLLFLSLLVLLSLTAFANNVSDIDISVSVDKKGNARVTQVWQGEFDEGTENYIVIGNLDGIEISDFAVSDENGEYTYLDSWNINSSREKKKAKCGIVENNGSYELCWGIGDYGRRRYTLSYTLNGLVASYDDKDGSNFMYVNPEMSTFPTNVTFSLILADGTLINDSIADIWAFGFDGEVRFDNGIITARTFSPLEDDMHFQIMFSLEKGVLLPTLVKETTFEDVKERAFKGSDYGTSTGETILVTAVLALIIAGVVGIVSYSVAVANERNKFKKNTNYFRDTPNNGEISVSYYLCRKFGVGGNEGDIISALILSMIDSGNIICDTEKSVSFFGKEKETNEIKLVSRPDKEPHGKLYDIMIRAAGEDGVLQEKELEKYSSKNYKVLRSFIDDCNEKGENSFCAMGGFATGISNRIKGLSDKGKEQLSEIVGMKKFLDEFSLISEREIGEVTIWKEYLVYAALFGSADKVLEEMKKLYPNNIPEIETYTRHVNMTGMYYSSMYRSMIRAEQKARSAGSGGRASFGGGGGFSGGGVGGGSR